jgi:hypothetical protein
MKLKLAVWDFGLHGAVKNELEPFQSDLCDQRIGEADDFQPEQQSLADRAIRIRQESGLAIGIAIGPIDRDEHQVARGCSSFQICISSSTNTETHEMKYWGHSAWREQRAAKQVLNQIRLYLQNMIVRK